MKAIGFATEYYTLWEVTKEKTYVTINNEPRFAGTKYNYTFFQNLSKDLDKAKEKFVKLTGLNAPEPDEELNGKNNSFSIFKKAEIYKVGEFPKGRYAGYSIADCKDIDYLLWAYNNMLEGENKDIAENALLSNGYVHNLWNDGVCTKEELEQQIENKKKAEFEKSIIRGFNFTDGEKVELDVTVHNIGGFNGYYGYTYIYDFITSDMKLVSYKGSKEYSDLNVGDKITIRGTIKHNSYYSNITEKEIKETKILRMKIIK